MASFYSVVKRGILSTKISPVVTCIRMKKIKPWHNEYEQPTFVYAGRSKDLKIRKDLYVVGAGEQGQLGQPNIFFSKKRSRVALKLKRPLRVMLDNDIKITDVSCGIHYTLLAVKSKTEISCLGTGLATDGQIGVHFPDNSETENGVHFTETDVPEDIGKKSYPFDILIRMTSIKFAADNEIAVKVACGRAHSIIATKNGNLFTLGNNAYGQCGRNILPNEKYTIASNFYKIDSFKGRTIDQIECGLDTSFVVCDGKVFSCGLSADGQTGQGIYENVEQFKPVMGDINNETVKKIACSADCVLAVTESGKLFGWGNGEYRQFSTVTEEPQLSTPVHLPLTIGKIIDAAATGSGCFVLTESGDVWSWGQGWLGRGPEAIQNSEPKIIPATLFGRTILEPNSKVTKLQAGVSMITAINTEGLLYSWGKNIDGCLGLGHSSDMYFPLRVNIAKKVQKVSCGESHMVITTVGII